MDSIVIFIEKILDILYIYLSYDILTRDMNADDDVLLIPRLNDRLGQKMRVGENGTIT